MSACNARRTEAIGILSWFADSDAAPRATLAHQDLLCAAFVSSRTQGTLDHVSYENVLLSTDFPAA